MVATDLTVELDDPRVGPILQLGPLAKIPGAPADVRTPAPEPGEHTEDVLTADVTPVALSAPTRERLAGPLEGITIVEAAYYYATPFATALLAELGPASSRWNRSTATRTGSWAGAVETPSPPSATTTWSGPWPARSRSP